MRIKVKFPENDQADEYEVESVEFPEKVVVEAGTYAVVVREPGCEVAH